MSKQFDSDGEATRAIKAALRKAFPGAKFTVSTSSCPSIEWTDDGPTIEQVQDVVVKAGCVKFDATTYMRPAFLVQGHHLYFNRYNAAERTAEKEDRARRQQEYEEQRRRVNEAIAAASQAKRDAMPKPPPRVPAAPIDNQAAYAAFEALRERAERDVATDDVEWQRRPSCGYPLIVEGELHEALIILGLLEPKDIPIARLWGGFADPKKRGQVLREQRSEYSLPGIACRGFQLHAGAERGPTSAILFEAQRKEAGKWQFGPVHHPSSYYSPKRSEWERLVSEREYARAGCSFLPPDETKAQIDRFSARIAEIDAEDMAGAQQYHERGRLRARMFELAQARVLDFAGAPGVQMALAGRLWGHCFNCGRALTDPISLERGIGPECIVRKIEQIEYLGVKGRDVGSIAFLTGMPEDFVTAVLNAHEVA